MVIFASLMSSNITAIFAHVLPRPCSSKLQCRKPHFFTKSKAHRYLHYFEILLHTLFEPFSGAVKDYCLLVIAPIALMLLFSLCKMCMYQYNGHDYRLLN